MAQLRNSTHGFTLIELTVVIVILGILAVTVAPKFIDLTDNPFPLYFSLYFPQKSN